MMDIEKKLGMYEKKMMPKKHMMEEKRMMKKEMIKEKPMRKMEKKKDHFPFKLMEGHRAR